MQKKIPLPESRDVKFFDYQLTLILTLRFSVVGP